MKMKNILFSVLCLALLVFNTAVHAASDSKGKNFVIAFPPNHTGGELLVHISSDIGAQGTVEIPGLAFVQPFNVAANDIIKIVIPIEAMQLPLDQISSLGILITSDNDITVYALNKRLYSTDAYMALPVDTLGLDYIIMSYVALAPSQLTVAAVYDNTEVTITPSMYAWPHAAGEPFKLILNRGETYYLYNYSDLTGSAISASKPVSVFGGVFCAYVPQQNVACDHIVEMMPPLSTWGKSFLTVPLASRLKGDIFRVLASTDNTVVSINNVNVATLNRGEFYESFITERSHIIATEPVLVAQYSVGQSVDGVLADPFMMLVPPGEQFLNNYSFTSVIQDPAESANWRHYVNVVVPTTSIDSIILDGALIDPSLFSPIADTTFSGAQIQVQEGSHHITSTAPFGIYVYGFGYYESYGYPGGMSFELINSNGDIFFPNVRLIDTNGVIQGTANDSEDLNLNGMLDAGEDLNGNGQIGPRTEDINGNQILDAGEDTNNNGILDRDTGIFRVELEVGSSNLQLQFDPFVPGASNVTFTVTRIDTSQPASGAVVVSDGAGNRTSRNIQIDNSGILNNVRVISTLSSDRIDLDAASFTVQPFSTNVVNGSTVIEWRFNRFDIGQTQDLAFDVFLRNPVPGETKQITQKLDLYFTDANGNEVHSGLGSQSVQVQSSIHTISVNTDRNQYTSDETVNINGVVSNLSEVAGTTNIQLSVRDSQGALVSDLGSYPNTALAANGSFTLPTTQFNTGRFFEGMYLVQANLLDANGSVYAKAQAPFVIASATSNQVSTSVSTDKPEYSAYETSNVQMRVRNVSTNTVAENMSAEVSLYGPGGLVIWSETTSLPQLLPGALRDFNYSIPLGRALPGVYTVRVVIKDNNGVERAMSESNFSVRSSELTGAGLIGELHLSQATVLKSETLTLSAKIKNEGNSDLQNLPVTISIIDPLNQQIVQQWTQTVASLAFQTEIGIDQNWFADRPEGSTYLAVLSAEINGTSKPLAQAPFKIGDKFATQLSVGEKGRLLVWLGGTSKTYDDDHSDSYESGYYEHDSEESSEHESDYKYTTTNTNQEQRAYLEARLAQAGWSQYTIVSSKDEFINELHRGGYSVYALLGSAITLNEELEHELTEAVNRGEGLVIAANVNEMPDDALGIDETDSDAKTSSITLVDSPLHGAGELVFTQALNINGIKNKGAQPIATFTSQTYYEREYEHDSYEYQSPRTAITRHAYGAGRSVYIGFDLLSEAMRTGGDTNDFSQILVNALADVNPQNLTYNEGLAVPIQLNLTNLGVASNGQVTVTLPAGSKVLDTGGATVSNETTLLWPFNLADKTSGTLTFWIQLPSGQSAITINATVSNTVNGTTVTHKPTALNVLITVPPALVDIINQLSPLAGLDEDYAEALQDLRSAKYALANGYKHKAHIKMLDAAEELSKHQLPEPEKASAIRLQLDGLIRTMAFDL